MFWIMSMVIFVVFKVLGVTLGLALVNLTLGFPPVLQRKQISSHVF